MLKTIKEKIKTNKKVGKKNGRVMKKKMSTILKANDAIKIMKNSKS